MRFRKLTARAFGGLLPFAIVLFAAGCMGDDPVDIEDIGGDVTGNWTAMSFGGLPLPIEEYFDDATKGVCRRILQGVDLSYATGGTYTWIEENTIECPSSGQVPTQQTVTYTGTWRVVGIHLFMDDSEPDTAEQDYTFSVQQNTLTMRVRYGSITLASVFQRG
jgi:hypothetical protein